MNVANWLYQTARNWPERPAVIDGTRCIHTYKTLAEAAFARAQRLVTLYGIEAGDRIAIFSRNCPEYIEILHALWWLGAIAVPINCKLHPKEVLWVLENTEARIIFTETGSVFEHLAPTREQKIAPAPTPQGIAPPLEVKTDDIAWLFYTSGTTGRPKGAMLSHGNLIQMTMCYSLDVDTCDSNDTMLYAAPISHGAGLYMLVAIRSAAKNLIPESRGFDEDEIISLARSQGNLVFFAAPTMVKRLVARANIVNFDGSGIRTIIYGGGPMYAADIDEALTLFGPKFVQIYGQGESPMTISVLSRDLVADTEHSRWRVRRSSVGIPHACVSLRILDADGNACPVGDTGEIAVHSPTVMQAYWRNPEATAETIQDGWLMTGDLGHMDEDGFLFLTDRSKDVIISGGTNIYPREVEEVLLRHPAIFEAAVIGKAEPHWGEQVVAFVVLRDEYECTSADLDSFCQAEIAAFKRPKKYLFVSSLPKNNYGKILKHELRKICQNQI